MANQLVRDLVAELPWRLRESVEGYVDTVAGSLPDIEKDAGVKLPGDKIELFLFIVAVRRVWAAVNSQYWIIQDTVTIARSRDLDGFQAGRDRYALGSDAMLESLELRKELEAVIAKVEIEALVTARRLADVVYQMSSEK